jgi:MurNAc alpha-1-phosphate uridylyltransferase
MERHLAQRGDMEILISDERRGLLDSGGRASATRPTSWAAIPIFLANIDSLWLNRGQPPLELLKGAWNQDAMDLLMLLVERGTGSASRAARASSATRPGGSPTRRPTWSRPMSTSASAS